MGPPAAAGGRELSGRPTPARRGSLSRRRLATEAWTEPCGPPTEWALGRLTELWAERSHAPVLTVVAMVAVAAQSDEIGQGIGLATMGQWCAVVDMQGAGGAIPAALAAAATITGQGGSPSHHPFGRQVDGPDLRRGSGRTGTGPAERVGWHGPAV